MKYLWKTSLVIACYLASLLPQLCHAVEFCNRRNFTISTFTTATESPREGYINVSGTVISTCPGARTVHVYIVGKNAAGDIVQKHFVRQTVPGRGSAPFRSVWMQKQDNVQSYEVFVEDVFLPFTPRF